MTKTKLKMLPALEYRDELWSKMGSLKNALSQLYNILNEAYLFLIKIYVKLRQFLASCSDQPPADIKGTDCDGAERIKYVFDEQQRSCCVYRFDH